MPTGKYWGEDGTWAACKLRLQEGPRPRLAANDHKTCLGEPNHTKPQNLLSLLQEDVWALSW